MIVTAQLGPIARDFGVEKQMITILGLTMPLLVLAVSIDNLTNGLTRPFAGLLSDKIGRENAMLLMFCAEGVAFLGKVLDDLGSLVNADKKRVYACGMSNGAMMCYRLAAEMSDRIAAVAPVAGFLP